MPKAIVRPTPSLSSRPPGSAGVRVARTAAAAGMLAAFAQLGVAKTAAADEPSPPPPVEISILDSLREFYEQLFDSQNN